MKLYLDVEFNGFGGELLSLALVDENERSFYFERILPEKVHPWVVENVISKMGYALSVADHEYSFSDPWEKVSFGLGAFLSVYPSVEVIADWCEDFVHFFRLLSPKPGRQLITPTITTKLVPKPKNDEEPVHHALEDALALCRYYRSDIEEGDLEATETGICSDCGFELDLVRPGKHQCNYCDT